LDDFFKNDFSVLFGGFSQDTVEYDKKADDRENIPGIVCGKGFVQDTVDNVGNKHHKHAVDQKPVFWAGFQDEHGDD